ncbi:hypothetical protein [uncultured Alistipes sp.]|uniref:hypothetical protein n=1 Tax=uncultured Alistipes sp. TaxID=538949 RepID=UPI002597EF5F|nr:hypothetical protein [uncultured Alistipes sp.]
MSSSVRLLSLSIIALWKLPAITAAAVPATSERYCRQFCPPPKKKQIKHFSRMMMPVTKTDEKDAYMIAMYGEKMNPPIYKMPSQATIRILTTEGFTYFDNAKQLSRFIGICPTYQQSRTSVNIREHINRNDDERLKGK